MSDVFPGPGWWLASDGLWYEASTHPDPSYRAAFAADDAAEPDVAECTSDDASVADEVAVPDGDSAAAENSAAAEDVEPAEAIGDEVAGEVVTGEVAVDEIATQDVVNEVVDEVVVDEEPTGPTSDFPSVEITPPHEGGSGGTGGSGQLGSVLRSAANLPAKEEDDDPSGDAGEGPDTTGAEKTKKPTVGLTFAGGGTVASASSVVVEELTPPAVPTEPAPVAAPSFEAPVIAPVEAEESASVVEETVIDVSGTDITDTTETVEEQLETVEDQPEPEDVGVPTIAKGWHKIEDDDFVADPGAVTPSPEAVTPSPEAVTPSPEAVTNPPRAVTPSPEAVTNPPRTQAQAFEDARRARLAEAQKSAEQLRDSVRRARERDANGEGAGPSPDRDAAPNGAPSLRMRTPGAPLTTHGAPESGATPTPRLKVDGDPSAATAPTVAGRTKLEIKPETPSAAPKIGLTTAEPTPTTALVHVPEATLPRNDGMDRLLSVGLFLSGLAMIAGTFMVWTTGTVDEVGWDRSDGVIVVVAGVVAATAAGPLFAGVRSFARGLAIVAGVVAVMVVGVAAITALSNTEETGLSVGTGLIVVLIAAVVAIISAASIRNQPFY